jgi:hypothetical protein
MTRRKEKRMTPDLPSELVKEEFQHVYVCDREFPIMCLE